MKDFFISYNRADRTWAEWIAWQLEGNGFTTIVQAWDFRPGSNFVVDMDKAAKDAARTIAVLSPDYLAARFPQPEWTAAFAQDPTSEKGILLPVRVRECTPTGLLSQIEYIDLVGLAEDAAGNALLVGVQRARAKPTVAAPFPGGVPHAQPTAPRFPGALPPIWNVPRQPNPNFTGRAKAFAELQQNLANGPPAMSSVRKVAICGLGGVGKTQLVTAYAYRRQADYALVWWLRAETPATLAEDYAALARPLQLPEADAVEQPRIVAAVRRWLEQNQGWLLIFDNATGPDTVRAYWPAGGDGHILITSRNPNWRGAATPLSLPVFSPEEAVAFLQNRAGQTDATGAAALADALGALPLALEQAAAYIEGTKLSFAGYLERFQTHQRQLLQRGAPTADYPATVATTWAIAMQEVATVSPAAVELLQLCAYLAPDDIPVELVQAGGDYFPPTLAEAVADPLLWDDAVAALRRYSLLEISDGALEVHRLVQLVVRDRLDDAAQQLWATAAVQLVSDVFPFDSDNVRTWPVCARLLPHAQAVTAYAESLAVVPETTGHMLNQMGAYAYGRAAYGEAKAAFERATAIAEAAFGPNHPTVAIRVNNLGSVLHALGDLAGAKAAFERALAIDEIASGPDDPTVARDVNNLGSVLRALGDLAGAKAAFERALAINEAAFGPDDPTVATGVNNLGNVLRDLGDLAGAKAAFERALPIFHQLLDDHPNVATLTNNLGNVLRDLGDLADAKAAFERALAIDEAAFGRAHPSVATDVNNLGLVLRDLGDLAGAKAAFERALAIFRQFLGDDHPSTHMVRDNLAVLEA